MNKYITVAAVALFTACAPQNAPIKATPKQAHKLTLSPHIYRYNPENAIRVDMTVSRIEKTYFLNDDNFQSWYYTVYATDAENNLYCIADDLEVENIAGHEYMLCLGNQVMLIYEKGKPDYTGEILPLNDWNN